MEKQTDQLSVEVVKVLWNQVPDQDKSIVERIMEGKPSKEIACIYKLSSSQVRNRIDTIRYKFGCHNTVHLVTVLFRAGVLK